MDLPLTGPPNQVEKRHELSMREALKRFKKDYRTGKRLSYVHIAERCGLSKVTVECALKGMRKVTFRTGVLISEAMGCTARQVLDFTDRMRERRKAGERSGEIERPAWFRNQKSRERKKRRDQREAWLAARNMATVIILAMVAGACATRPVLPTTTERYYTPKLDNQLWIRPASAMTAVSVTVTARLGPEEVKRFTCAGIKWVWGDGTESSNEVDDCSLVRPVIQSRHTYSFAGSFCPSIHLISGGNTLYSVRCSTPLQIGAPISDEQSFPSLNSPVENE